MKIIYSILTVFIFITACSNKSQLSKDLKEKTYYYEVNANPIGSSLELNISLSYSRDSIHKVYLPSDYYGTPDIYKYVTNFKGLKGTQVIDKGKFKIVTPNQNNEVHLKYDVKYDNTIDKYSYAPKVDKDFFYLAGCQFILPSYPLDSVSTYEIKMSASKNGWDFYSSLSGNAEYIKTKSSFDDLISAGFGGSSKNGIKETFNVEKDTISVYINGDFSFDKEQFISSLKQVITNQKNFFKDYDQPFYNITILPRDGLMAGSSIPNLFYCFVDSSKEGVDLYKLISHEFFHNWLPDKFNLITPPGQYYSQREWFSEGFTEYFARLFLLESKIIAQNEFVDLFNDDIVKIENSPYGYKSYDLIRKSKTNGAAKKKLNYYRGALIALKWDTELKQKGSSLKKMILHLFQESKSQNGFIDDSLLYEFGMQYGFDFKDDIHRYTILGEKIKLMDSAFEGFELRKSSVKLFYPGFNVNDSANKKIIDGVDSNGPSYKAGLRNGMEYVKRKNSNIWSNSWSKNEPYIVTVKVNDNIKDIAFFPYGQERLIYQYIEIPN